MGGKSRGGKEIHTKARRRKGHKVVVSNFLLFVVDVNSFTDVRTA
jgi:hypothetical protein